MDLGIPGYDDLVWGVSLFCDRIDSSTQQIIKGKGEQSDYFNARARSKIIKFRRDYAAKNIAFAPAILCIQAKFTLNLYISCG